MPKTKSKKQVGYLLSSGSPLTPEQKNKLKSELHSGEVTVSKSKAPPPKAQPKKKKGKKGKKSKKGKGSSSPMMTNPIGAAMGGMPMMGGM